MDFQTILSEFGLGELVIQDFFLLQVGLLAATLTGFAMTLGLAFLSFRAARASRLAAHQAREDLLMATEARREAAAIRQEITQIAIGANMAANPPGPREVDANSENLREALSLLEQSANEQREQTGDVGPRFLWQAAATSSSSESEGKARQFGSEVGAVVRFFKSRSAAG